MLIFSGSEIVAKRGGGWLGDNSIQNAVGEENEVQEQNFEMGGPRQILH